MATTGAEIAATASKDTTYFALTLLGLSGIAIVYTITAMSVGMKRGKIFTKEFMSQFEEECQEALGHSAPMGGNPDDGNGYFSRKLSYADWYEFNNYQRSHLNFLETIMPVVVCVFITSINQALWACISVFVLLIGRICYAIGYQKGGPKGRLVGAILWDLGMLSVLIGSFVSVFQWKSAPAATTA